MGEGRVRGAQSDGTEGVGCGVWCGGVTYFDAAVVRVHVLQPAVGEDVQRGGHPHWRALGPGRHLGPELHGR